MRPRCRRRKGRRPDSFGKNPSNWEMEQKSGLSGSCGGRDGRALTGVAAPLAPQRRGPDAHDLRVAVRPEDAGPGSPIAVPHRESRGERTPVAAIAGSEQDQDARIERLLDLQRHIAAGLKA